MLLFIHKFIPMLVGNIYKIMANVVTDFQVEKYSFADNIAKIMLLHSF